MKNLFFLLFITSFLAGSCQQNSHSTSSSQHQVLASKEFNNKLKSLSGAQLVDVRTSEECAAGKIGNARNIDFYASDFSQKIMSLDPKKPVFIYCKGGVRSAKAAQIMKSKGFKEIYELSGGYDSYTR
jgi:rhodanese-related sulfurtransferase